MERVIVEGFGRQEGQKSTSAVSKLATSLKRKDEEPNVTLAQKIASRGDKKAVKELVDNLTNKDKGIQADCIKVLYEVGNRDPSLIVDYAMTFVELLGSANNRLVWGAMTALDTVTDKSPEAVYSALPRILEVADSGSVITRDHAVSILIKLASIGKHRDEALGHLKRQLVSSPPNQLPMYAEKVLPIISYDDRADFAKVLSSRIKSLKTPSKKKRVELVIKKLGERSKQ